MAFFIRQVDRRFSATTALGWAFFNMVLTVVIAFAFEFETYAALEASLFIPIFCGLWIVFFTLGALTLDSNVLLACRDFSKPLRAMMKTGSKDSKDKTPKNASTSGKNSAEKDENSAKVSHSSTIFVLNREMFPTKYDDFDGELLEQILHELKFQVAAVRRALIPAGGTSTTTVEIERPRNSTKVDAGRVTSKSKFELALPTRNSRGSSTSGDLPPLTPVQQKVSVQGDLPPLTPVPAKVSMVRPDLLPHCVSNADRDLIAPFRNLSPEPATTSTHTDSTSPSVLVPIED